MGKRQGEAFYRAQKLKGEARRARHAGDSRSKPRITRDGIACSEPMPRRGLEEKRGRDPWSDSATENQWPSPTKGPDPTSADTPPVPVVAPVLRSRIRWEKASGTTDRVEKLPRNHSGGNGVREENRSIKVISLSAAWQSQRDPTALRLILADDLPLSR